MSHLPQLIALLFNQKYFCGTVAALFEEIEPLFKQEYNKATTTKDGTAAVSSSSSSSSKLNLLWSKILFHIVSLAKEDGSQALLEKSLLASRQSLIDYQNSSTNNNNNNNNSGDQQRIIIVQKLNFMIREVTSRLFPGIRVVLSTSSSSSSSNDDNSSLASYYSSSFRTMVSSQDQSPSNVICQEAPFAVWEGSSMQHGLDAIHENSDNTHSNNFQKQQQKRFKVDSLWCPDLYLSEAISTFLSARRTTTSPDNNKNEKNSTTRQEVRDVCALKSNCHHYISSSSNGGENETEEKQNEDKIAVFDVLSKISHSCSPNCFYDGSGRLIIGGNSIETGELLSFPYFHRKYLIRSTDVRREALDQSHNFTCSCARCMNLDPRLHGRCFVCRNQTCSSSGVNSSSKLSSYYSEVVSISSGSVSSSSSFILPTINPLVTENPLRPGDSTSRKWQCLHCNDIAAPTTEIAQRCFMIEARLQQSTADNLSQLSLSSSSVPKNIFEKLKSDMMDCLNHLGKNHWLYLECVRALIQFYLRVGLPPSSSSSSSSQKTSEQTKLTCLEFAVRWSMKFISSCHHQGILSISSSSSSSSTSFSSSSLSPAAAGSYAVEAAKAILDHCPNSQWRIHAALIIQLVIDIDPGFAKTQLLTSIAEENKKNEILDLASKALQIFNENNDHSWTASSSSSSSSSSKPKNNNSTSSTRSISNSSNNTNKPSTPLAALVRTADIVDSDDSSLISGWENHLADRVNAFLQKSSGSGSSSSDVAAKMIRSQLNLPPQQ